MSNTLDNSRPERDASCDHEPDDESSQCTTFANRGKLGGEPECHVGGDLDVEVMVDDSVDSPAKAEHVKRAVRAAATYRGFRRGEIGVRISNDTTIRDLNRKHLGHDYATDVISFGYSIDGDVVTGELVVSAETASRLTERKTPGWSAEAELILYIVHGTLHVTGMDDHEPNDRKAMRHSETAIMSALGFTDVQRYGADQMESDR